MMVNNIGSLEKLFKASKFLIVLVKDKQNQIHFQIPIVSVYFD